MACVLLQTRSTPSLLSSSKETKPLHNNETSPTFIHNKGHQAQAVPPLDLNKTDLSKVEVELTTELIHKTIQRYKMSQRSLSASNLVPALKLTNLGKQSPPPTSLSQTSLLNLLPNANNPTPPPQIGQQPLGSPRVPTPLSASANSLNVSGKRLVSSTSSGRPPVKLLPEEILVRVLGQLERPTDNSAEQSDVFAILFELVT